MSSPFIPPVSGYPDRVTASSPDSNNRWSGASDPLPNVSIRPMRLKILYTFDDQNKTNCLARWPQLLDIRTAYLDATTQIGIIELKTCIQAIVSASPELVAKLGQDYTVYAYDYSEYETPLVGQGMLSWVLASSSSTPSAPAHQSRTMVTGRVCKNNLGLFSNGTQETLEVKLRLVPVPTCLQSEYLESMRRYRDLSKIMPEGFDSQAWTSFLQANPGILQGVDQSRCQTPMNGTGQKEFGLEHVQRLLNEGGASADTGNETCDQRRPSFTSTELSQDPLRSASPALSYQSSTARPPQQGKMSRPGSRVSNRGGLRPAFARSDSSDLWYASNDEQFEEGPTKKRAKVSKAEWPMKGNFGKQVDSLRVAASTAASVRVYQPTAIRPSSSAANALEEPPRAPTPIPDSTNHLRRPLLSAQRSSLRRESYTTSGSGYKSPYAASDEPARPLDSDMTSPEENVTSNIINSPADINSSPPVMRAVSPTPSSPVLPTLPRHIDSGFMSGSVDELFEDDEDRPVDELDAQVAAQYQKRPGLNPVVASKRKTTEEATTETTIVQEQQDEQQNKLHETDTLVASSTQESTSRRSKTLNRTASSCGLMHVAASDPVLPTKGSLHRSLTWSGQSQFPASDTPMGTEGIEAPRSRREIRNGSGVRRKKAIQSKLAASIAAGEMPPFCDNCGSVETPTWRKAYTKLHSGTPELVRISDELGGIIAWQPLQTDENRAVNLFKIIKKSLAQGEVGFTEILLCNPCGLWLFNHRCMRPEEVWQRAQNQKGPDEKPKRGGRRKKAKTQNEQDQTKNNLAPGASEASSPNGATDADDNVQDSGGGDEPQLPSVKRSRASNKLDATSQLNSEGMTGPTAAAALQRAIQSSPARFLGTQYVPIEVDELTPKPTRRVLFPTPPKVGDMTSGRGDTFSAGNRSQDISPQNVGHIEHDQADKENRPPAGKPDHANDDTTLDDLFEDLPHVATCPSTPTRFRSISPSDPFKTPPFIAKTPSRALNTGDFFSSAAKAFLLPPITPKRSPHKSSLMPLGEMTPFTAHLNQLLSEPNAHNGNNGSSPAGTMSHDFDFSQFDPHDLLGAEGEGDVMPSSPPIVGWFGVYEDPIDEGGFELGSSPRVGGVENQG